MSNSSIKALLLSILFTIVVAFIGFQTTYALFSDSATSTDNVFSAAAEFPTATPIPVQPGDIVINEIMWMGMQGNAADEWIELRNMTNHTIDLSNWVVVNLGTGAGPAGTITIPMGKTIAPNGYFLISNDSKATSIINVDPDVQDSSVSLQNPGEQLVLKTASAGATIDVADTDGGGWFAGDDTNTHEKSMERNNIPSDGTVSTNWHTAITQINLDAGNDEVATPRAANGL